MRPRTAPMDSMQDTAIYLITATYSRDDYGREVETETKRQVFANLSSITRSEWFEGHQNNLNPDHLFTVFHADYQGEATLEWEGKRYGIYRTYRTGDYVELYAEGKDGLNG